MLKLTMTKEDAEREEYVPPPSDTYTCVISDVKLEQVKKKSENHGRNYWKMVLIVEEGQKTGKDYAGKPIYENYIPLHETKFGLWKLNSICKAVRPELVKGNDITLPVVDNGNPDPAPFLQQKINVKIVTKRAGDMHKQEKLVDDLLIIKNYYPASAPRLADDDIVPA